MAEKAKKRKLTAKARKRMGYGRVKGGAFERKICKDIVEAFSMKPQDCYRSIQSGAHKDSFGDITMSSKLAEMFPYAPECKAYSKIDLNVLFRPWKKMNKNSWFKKWWNQTLHGAEKCGRAPLLVFKANGKEVLCAVPFENRPPRNYPEPNMFVYYRNDIEIWIGSWNSFLSACVKKSATSGSFRKHHKEEEYGHGCDWRRRRRG